MPGLISVIIPAYNHQAYVEACLDSVLASTYPHKEIVIIDDGSKDETAATIQRWKDRNASIINVTFRSRPNKGVSATINEAVSLAQGDTLALIASDDYLLPNGLTQRAAYLESHPELGAVFGDCNVVDTQGLLLNESCLRSLHKTNIERYKTPRGVAWSIVCRWAIAGPGLMIRRDCFHAIGGYDETRVIEDWDFYLRLASRQLLGFIDVPVAAYRVHSANSCGGASRQGFILKELTATALKRAKEFSFPLNLLVLAKAVLYSIRRSLLPSNHPSL